MNEFIQMAMKQLGTNETTTRSITGKVLGFIKEKAGGADFTQLMDKLPGASQLAEASGQAPAQEKASGELVGRILGQVPDLKKLAS